MPIDYSKWDKLSVSDDENSNSGCPSACSDHEDGPPAAQAMPVRQRTYGAEGIQVTQLAPGSRVTFGNGAASVAPPVAPPRVQPATSGGEQSRTTPFSAAALPQADDGGDDFDDDDMFVASFTRNGNAAKVISLRGDAAAGDSSLQHLWGQTKDSVRVAFLLPRTETRAKDVSGVVVTPTSLAFRLGGTAQYHFELAYQVRDEERFVEGCWELKSVQSRRWRLLIVQLEKVVVGQGVYLWWDRFLKNDVPLDVNQFPDRVAAPGERQRAEAFKAAWDEAHAMFRQKRREEAEQRARCESSEAQELLES